MTSSPVTDAFGTRLDPVELLSGLDALGLESARLVVHDDGIVLECPDPDERRDDVAKALTWLRTRFSPLVPARVARSSSGPRFDDQRRRPLTIVAIVEVLDPDRGFDEAVDTLFERLGAEVPSGAVSPPPPSVDEPLHTEWARRLANALESRGSAASIAVLLQTKRGMNLFGALESGGSGVHCLLWARPGGETGVRRAVLIAACQRPEPLGWLAEALSDRQQPLPPGQDILFDGVAWGVARRPTIAHRGELPILVDGERCIDCTICAAVCPTGYLGAGGEPTTERTDRCIRCYDCVEACPTDALRPSYAADSGLRASALEHRPGWLSRLAGALGPSFPAPFPPSYLLPKPSPPERPRYVLGLAIVSMQEHAAVLLQDGHVVGAIEHERLVRIRHAGWHPPGRPGVTIAVDPTLCLEEAFCRRPIRALLERAGITLDDVDLIAVNGLHGRYRHAFSYISPDPQVPVLESGRVVFVPHHLSHAASAFRQSEADSGWIFTVDGRGDRECAAVFRAEHDRIQPVDTVLALTDRSIGGVYEGVTRLLGFGSHGQGSVMALASFGEPSYDMSAHLSAHGVDEQIHESGINEAFAELARDPSAPPEPAHQNLAASLQQALEQVAQTLVERNAGTGPLDALCLGGGVALNCRMNESLRQRFQPESIFVQPGANDAGTALGAALESWHRAGGERVESFEHAYLGPDFSDHEIELALRRSGLRHRRVDSVAQTAAELIAEGKVVCWFQGRMEFGPRALGARSILADPRKPENHERVNQIKERERWRPFGPSILAGHEDDWLENAFDARFMLFTLMVKKRQRERIPAVVHVDGTTRPQVVHRETSPIYHALIEAFHERTGVPMLLNTSFNRRGEPIVCTPGDAIDSFLGLGADYLVMGNYLVDPLVKHQTNDDVSALPGGRRLSLRLTSRCDLDCTHCTLRDLAGHADRSDHELEQALADGRRAGCDELVLLRGEASLRPDLPDVVRRARAMGYRYVQLQTNAVPLSVPGAVGRLTAAGVNTFEVMLLSGNETLHDRLTGVPGSLRHAVKALQELSRSEAEVLVTVPVLRQNMRRLGSVVELVRKLRLKRVQFAFPRPVELVDRVVTDPIPRLTTAAHYVRQAAEMATRAGLEVSTEAFPFCHLPEPLRASPDATEDWSRHRIDDLHLVHESLGSVRDSQRPELPPCRRCSERAACPKTWALYTELFGSEELVPFE